MRSIFKNILFNSALAVILLHTFIPHPHSEDMVVKEHIKLHKNSNSFYGILKLVFHESDDENLDSLVFTEYNIDKKTNVDYTSPEIDLKYLSLPKAVKKTVCINSKSNIHKLFIVNLNDVRGPPALTTYKFRI